MTNLNQDPGEIMNRVLEIYGEDWEQKDLPTYYRQEQAERDMRLTEEVEREEFLRKQKIE